MGFLSRPSHRGQPPLLGMRQSRNCITFSPLEGYLMSLHMSKETLPSPSIPSPHPTLVPTVHQALITDALPLFISHLVMVHDCLGRLIAYFIDFISQEAGNYTWCTVIPFSSPLGKFIVLYPSLEPFTSLVTVMSFLFLAKFSLFIGLLICS